jgi:putative acetyltransferase
VDALRAAGGLSISAVAEEDGRVVGHIAFSPVSIENSRESFPALALAPMAVHPEWQRQGIGSALVRWSLDECRREGHQLVIVLGHAEYYPRFGFVPARPLGILCPFDVPDEVFRLLELQPGALGARTGKVSYRPEFLQV